MDNAPRKSRLRLVKDEAGESPDLLAITPEAPPLKSALARRLSAFADDLDAQIALLLSQD